MSQLGPESKAACLAVSTCPALNLSKQDLLSSLLEEQNVLADEENSTHLFFIPAPHQSSLLPGHPAVGQSHCLSPPSSCYLRPPTSAANPVCENHSPSSAPHSLSHTQFKRECKRVCMDLLWGRTLLLVPQQASSSSLQKPATPRRGLEHASPRPQDQQQRHRFPTTAGSDPPQTGAPCACRTPALGYHSQSSDQGLHRTHAVNHPS